jgi:putative colanic acid biosynthesis UDP-glucose lipid carrier transferase
MTASVTRIEARADAAASDAARDARADVMERAARTKISGVWGRAQKALFDYGLSAFLIVATAPVMAAIAVAIKLDSSGPVLFRQHRHGRDHRIFNMVKFRTMTVVEDSNDVRHVMPNDDRVTRVGRFLRRNGLDELPQLINVLRNEMSLIGPRPHAIAHHEEFRSIIEGFDDRHKVNPGISGWAQVNGCRGSADTPAKMKTRVDYDLLYIENWSIALDIKIFLMSGLLLFRTLTDFHAKNTQV